MKPLEWSRTLFTDRYLLLALRVYIGAIFIYASMYKINYSAEFAATIASYQLVPIWAVNLTAIIMPWLELVCGLLLVVGFRTKAAAAVIAALLVLFSLAVAITLLRAIPIGCGCFHSLEEPMSWHTLLRDLGWLAITLLIFFFDSAWQLEKRFVPIVKDL